MKKIVFLSLICMVVSSSLWAQKSSSEGYFNLTQLSFLIADENEYSPIKSNMAPSVVTVHGHRFNEHFSLGAGVGVTAMSYLIFPVFADFRVTFLKGDLSPVVSVKGGYAFANSKKETFQEYYGDFKNTGGAMFNPEIGFKIPMTDRANFMLTVGYWYQHVRSEIRNKPDNFDYGIGTHNRTSDLNRLSFSVGFMFK